MRVARLFVKSKSIDVDSSCTKVEKSGTILRGQLRPAARAEGGGGIPSNGEKDLVRLWHPLSEREDQLRKDF